MPFYGLSDPNSCDKKNEGLFGKNGTVPSGDRFCCEKGLPSVLKQKEKWHLYGETERNRCIQTDPDGWMGILVYIK